MSGQPAPWCGRGPASPGCCRQILFLWLPWKFGRHRRTRGPEAFVRRRRAPAGGAGGAAGLREAPYGCRSAARRPENAVWVSFRCRKAGKRRMGVPSRVAGARPGPERLVPMCRQPPSAGSWRLYPSRPAGLTESPDFRKVTGIFSGYKGFYLDAPVCLDASGEWAASLHDRPSGACRPILS